MLRSLSLLAQTLTFGESFFHATAYGLLGLLLLLFGLKLFDWLTPKLDIEKELSEKNLAVAIVVAALFLAMGYILARTVGA